MADKNDMKKESDDCSPKPDIHSEDQDRKFEQKIFWSPYEEMIKKPKR